MNKSIIIGIILALQINFISFPGQIAAGDLEPNMPPGPTMKTLDEIYSAITAQNSQHTFRSAYKSLPNDMNQQDPTIYELITVTTGKNFILTDMFITGGLNTWITIYEDSTSKTGLSTWTKHISFNSGIPFTSGSKVNVSLYGEWANLTITGYEY